MHSIQRFAGRFSGELQGARRYAADLRSFRQIVFDQLATRLFQFVPRLADGRERTVRMRGRMRDGVEISYRLDKGDIFSFREVWLYQVYRPPVALLVKSLLDIGAHIGLATLFFASQYEIERTLAVEPNPDNARLAQRNLERNQIPGQVVQAAAAVNDGHAWFSFGEMSNEGRLGEGDPSAQPGAIRVPTFTIPTLIDLLLQMPVQEQSKDSTSAEGLLKTVSLLKMDVEGNEAGLLSGELTWLEQVHALVVELHAGRVDTVRLIERLEAAGFHHSQDTGGTNLIVPTDFFLRTEFPIRP